MTSDGTSLLFSSRAQAEPIFQKSSSSRARALNFELFRAEPTKYGHMYRTRAITCQASIFCKFGSGMYSRGGMYLEGILKRNILARDFPEFTLKAHSINYRAKS